MMMAITKEEYYDYIIPRLPKYKKIVYDAIKEIGESTDRMCAQYLAIDSSRISGGRYELSLLGLIEISKRDKCKVTGKIANYWRLIDVNQLTLF